MTQDTTSVTLLYNSNPTQRSIFVTYLKYNIFTDNLKEENKTDKFTLMQEFMNNFVGKGFHLLIKEKDGTFQVHTIEIMQKTDDTCPVKEIPVGDYFLHLKATNQEGNDASIICNWTEELLADLMNNYKDAKDADAACITMYRDPSSSDANKWLLLWDTNEIHQKTDSIPYIS